MADSSNNKSDSTTPKRLPEVSEVSILHYLAKNNWEAVAFESYAKDRVELFGSLSKTATKSQQELRKKVANRVNYLKKNRRSLAKTLTKRGFETIEGFPIAFCETFDTPEKSSSGRKKTKASSTTTTQTLAATERRTHINNDKDTSKNSNNATSTTPTKTSAATESRQKTKASTARPTQTLVNRDTTSKLHTHKKKTVRKKTV